MTNKNEIYKCNVCGNIVEVLHASTGQLVCCNQPMQLLQENVVDASKEKHVPVIEKIASGDIKTDIRSFLSGGPVLPIPPVCGDGNTNVGEQCDDGDTSSGDGCSAICTVESGYTCSGEPSSCYYCGNNLVEGSEFCDSGNLNGQTCVTQGYDGGSLSCAGNCLSYNYGSCTSTCGNGQTQPCSNQVGVCSGSFETCAGNSWSVCGVSEYGVGYEATESSCSDALDNDCDGDTDGSDSNCPSDLLVHLTFDGNMLDSSGNANYGSCVGSACPLLTTDKDSNPNTAYSFDGSNDYINVNSAIDNLQSLSEGTIVLWVNINVNTGNINSFVSASDSSASNKILNFKIYAPSSSGIIEFNCGNSGSIVVVRTSSPKILPVGSWHQVALTMDSSGSKLYLDGSQITSGNLAYSTGSASTVCWFDTITNLDSVLIGGLRANSGTYYTQFNGKIDDVRIYNRALTSGEINDLFTGAPPAVCNDGTLESPEVCESGNLNGQTCVTQGYDGGSLSCAGNCLSYNYGSCTSTCGNGVISGSEQCDDGDTSSGDGCSAICTVESGYTCSGEPSSCNPLTPSSGTEQRCTELGTNCDCSEPMNINDGSILTGHDFTDSLNPTQCSNKYGYAFFETDKNNIVTSSEFGMPAGNNVNYVLEIPAVGANIAWMKGRMSVDNSIKRTCIRYYKMVSIDYSGAGYPGAGPGGSSCPSERNKVIQFQFGGTQVQLQELANDANCHGPGTPNSYNPLVITNPADPGGQIGNYYFNNGGVRWDDCWSTSGWCRIEMCGSGDLNQGTNINFEAKITPLATGIEHYAVQNVLWNPGVPMKSDTAGDLFHGQGQGGTGTEWISHFMQASWTTNSNQWIGSAYEIEGP